MGQGWRSLKTTVPAHLTTSSSTNPWRSVLVKESDTKHSSTQEKC